MFDESFWNGYQPGEITPQIRYWADFWAERVTSFPESKFGLKLDSPRLLLADISDEVTFNGLRNEKLKGYFAGKIKECLKERYLLNFELSAVLELLSSTVPSEKTTYVSELCKQGLHGLSGSDYLKHLVSLLLPLLLKSEYVDQKDYDKIEKITQLIIIEFMLNGYVLKTCSDFPKIVFDKYFYGPDGMLISEFPTKCSSDAFKTNGKIDFAAFGKARALEIDSLTITDRINALVTLYERPEGPFDFIFPLKNVRGKDELRIGNVTIYSPEHKKFSRDEKFSTLNMEFFHRKAPFIYNNAIVELKSKDFDFTRERASSIIESALDVLGFFSSAKGQPGVMRGTYLVLGKDGHMASMGAMTQKETVPDWVWTEAVDVAEPWRQGEEASFNGIADTLVSTTALLSGAKRQIATALHWHRKAQQEAHLEERLIDHWVALEKLFSDAEGQFGHEKFPAIVSLLPSVYIRKVVYNVGWDTFYYLRGLLNIHGIGPSALELSDEIIKEACLDFVEGRTIHIRDFVGSLGKISEQVNRRIIKEKIDLAKNYFTNPAFAANYLEAKIKEVETDLLLIYRYRNKIVHDAHFDDRLLPYYLAKIEQYSGNFLSYMLAKMNAGEGNIYEWATEEKAKIAKVIRLLKNGKDVDLIELLG